MTIQCIMKFTVSVYWTIKFAVKLWLSEFLHHNIGIGIASKLSICQALVTIR